MGETLITMAAIALAVAAAALTITRAVVFAPLRNWVAKHSDFFGELISCPYCTSHWLAIAGTVVFQPRITHTWLVLDLTLTAFVIVALATMLYGVVYTMAALVPGLPSEDEDEA